MRVRAEIKRATDWPRYMKVKKLRGKGRAGELAYYWEPHERDRAAGFSLPGEALGTNYAEARDRALMLNVHLDDWRRGRGQAGHSDFARAGTVDWWHEHYFRSEAFTRLSGRSQRDYRAALRRLADIETSLTIERTGCKRRFGELPVGSVSPAAVDKVYQRLRDGGRVTRQANYVIDVARRAWKVVARAHPSTFLINNPESPGARIALNPWVGVLRTFGTGTTKPCTREEAFALADALIAIGHPALAIVPLVSFELLQRPENVISGHLCWSQYRPAERPSEIEIFHHKTGTRIWHPLEIDDVDDGGNVVVRRLYPELEDRLAELPRCGVPVVMLQPKRGGLNKAGERTARTYSESYADNLVQKARRHAQLPAHVTLAACRHGGMTLLGDATLTEAQIMALSGHVTPSAARIYVKRTEVQRRQAALRRRDFIEGRGASSGTNEGR